MSLGPKIIRMMSIPSCSPKSQCLQAKALLYRVSCWKRPQRSGIEEQDAHRIAHNLARSAQTYAAKVNWPVLTIVGRLNCSKNSFVEANKSKSVPTGPSQHISMVSGSNNQPRGATIATAIGSCSSRWLILEWYLNWLTSKVVSMQSVLALFSHTWDDEL
jgi:hypothetical protein